MLIKNGTLLLGEELEVVQKDLRIDLGVIVEIGEKLSARDNEELVDASRQLISPGFINAHSHPAHSVSKGLIDGYDWDVGLSVLYHVDVKKTDDDRYWSSVLGFSESIFSGATTVVGIGSNIVGEVRAARELGLRTFLSKSYSDIYLNSGPAPRMMTIPEIQKDFESLRSEYSSELIDVHFGLSTDMGASDELFLLAAELAEKKHTRVQLHSCEMRSIVRRFKEDRGMHPILHYRKIGFLSDRLLLFHMTQIDREDVLDAIAESGAHIIHCPVANAKLADGILPLKELRARGVNVAFGTDADLNNNSSHLLGDLKTAALLHATRTHDAATLTAVDLLKMLTVNGAKALGRDDLGKISVGAKADLTFFDLRLPAFTPAYDVRSNLVYNASDIRPCHVMVNGEWIVRDYLLTRGNLAGAQEEVQKIAERIHVNLETAPKPRTVKKVYVSGALSDMHDPRVKAFYENIAAIAKDEGCEVFVPHVNGTDPEKNSDVSPEEVYERDVDQVLEADIIVAYAGHRSFGVGMEVMLAKMTGRTVFLLYPQEVYVNRMLRGAVPKTHHICFVDEENALQDFREKLQNLLK